jgi:hypothetical protein
LPASPYPISRCQTPSTPITTSNRNPRYLRAPRNSTVPACSPWLATRPRAPLLSSLSLRCVHEGRRVVYIDQARATPLRPLTVGIASC